MSAVLSARDVRVLRRGTAVLSGVTLSAQRGRVITLVGPNGAGKSTLLSVLAGILAPHEGTVLLDDTPLHAVSRRDAALRIASLGQSELPDEDLTALEAVLLGRAPHLGAWGLPGDDDIRWAEDALARTDVSALRDRRMGTLSGGERQRVLVARVLCQGGDVLLLDEPTGALDVGHALHVMKELRAQAAQGKAVVVAVHDLALAARFSDELVVMHRGRLLAQGDWETALAPGVLREAFGVPMRVQRVEGQPVVMLDGS
ncbi:MAG: ABC transporter ATP-binding protein [Myxococcota bacterium]